MKKLSREQIFITNQIQSSSKITKNAIDFYHELIELFEISNPLVSTSKKLAKRFNVHERSIQRYVKQLKEISLIHVRPIYNNDNPDKPYIEENHYSPTRISDDLQSSARNYVLRDRNVNFSHKATT